MKPLAVAITALTLFVAAPKAGLKLSVFVMAMNAIIEPR